MIVFAAEVLSLTILDAIENEIVAHGDHSINVMSLVKELLVLSKWQTSGPH